MTWGDVIRFPVSGHTYLAQPKPALGYLDYADIVHAVRPYKLRKHNPPSAAAA